MNRNIKNIAAVVFFALLGTSAIAQVSQQKIGQNPLTINSNAALEIESSNKGLLLPRLELQATNLAAPLIAHVQGMTVYNTAEKGSGETAVTPGYYYNDGTQWVRVADATDIKKEPWYDQATNAEATLNTQNIYQMGSVAIGKDEVYEGAALDVKGAIRAGADHQGEVGQYSAAFGLLNESSGTYTLATGSESIANGDHAISMGYMTIASGNYGSIAVGNESIASGQSAVAMGNHAKASGPGSISLGQITDSKGTGSVALGQGTVASTHGEVSVGIANAITTGSSPGIVPTDALFQIGNGSSSGTTVFFRSNAVTVLKNAHTGIGIAGTESDAKPTEMLDIGSKGVRIRDINTAAYSGNSATDNIVVADPNGVLKTLKAAMPKFFYMPSIIVPTSEEQMIAPNSGAVVGDTFDDSTRQGTINLYGRYQAQFGSPMRSNAGATTNLPVLPAGELDYHITWYDNELFTSVNVSDAGVLTYTVSPTADITIGSFMNIVFAVREN